MERAIQRSTNMVPVRLTQMMGPQASYDFMHDSLNMKSLVPEDIAPSPMALGSLTHGVTPMEMAGAYQMIANGGTYTEPYAYTHVLDSQDNIVLQRDVTQKRVISQETATVLNKLLQRVVTGPSGTGSRASLAATSPGIPVAGKTGTTDDDVDQWFIGLTPYYIGVAWLGYDDQFQYTLNEDGTKNILYDYAGDPIPNSIKYSSYPPPILWNTVMRVVHEGLEPKQFNYSSNVVAMAYCTSTGYAATQECESTSTGWYKSTNIPSSCPEHGSGLSSDFNTAGYKPWVAEENPIAPYDPEWAWMYPDADPDDDPRHDPDYGKDEDEDDEDEDEDNDKDDNGGYDDRFDENGWLKD